MALRGADYSRFETRAGLRDGCFSLKQSFLLRIAAHLRNFTMGADVQFPAAWNADTDSFDRKLYEVVLHLEFC